MNQRGAADNQTKPGRAAGGITSGVLRLIDGVPTLDTASTDADGYLINDDGVPTMDTAVSSGQRVVKAPREILSY